jgi:hypothetical protein
MMDIPHWAVFPLSCVAYATILIGVIQFVKWMHKG